MKISYYNNSVYLIVNDGSIWGFHAQLPEGYVHLGECYTTDEEGVRKNAVELTKESLSNIRKYIDGDGMAKEVNYEQICGILGNELNISMEMLNKAFNYDKNAIELCKKIRSGRLDNFALYNDCIKYLEKWDGDKDRAEKFIKRFCRGWDGVLVDIWPSKEDLKRPTWNSESWLLHEFHNTNGEILNDIIREAVTKYPDFKDIDYAGYYVDEKIGEYYAELSKKIIKEKNKKNGEK